MAKPSQKFLDFLDTLDAEEQAAAPAKPPKKVVNEEAAARAAFGKDEYYQFLKDEAYAEPTTAESVLAGVAKAGTTLGFNLSDEVAGAQEAAGVDPMMALAFPATIPFQMGKRLYDDLKEGDPLAFVDRYRQGKSNQQQQLQTLEEQSPLATGVGELGGMAAGMVLTPGAVRAADVVRAGVVGGGAGGFGSTDGDAATVGGATLMGAGVGGLLGKAGQFAGNVTRRFNAERSMMGLDELEAEAAKAGAKMTLPLRTRLGMEARAVGNEVLEPVRAAAPSVTGFGSRVLAEIRKDPAFTKGGLAVRVLRAAANNPKPNGGRPSWVTGLQDDVPQMARGPDPAESPVLSLEELEGMRGPEVLNDYYSQMQDVAAMQSAPPARRQTPIELADAEVLPPPIAEDPTRVRPVIDVTDDMVVGTGSAQPAPAPANRSTAPFAPRTDEDIARFVKSLEELEAEWGIGQSPRPKQGFVDENPDFHRSYNERRREQDIDNIVGRAVFDRFEDEMFKKSPNGITVDEAKQKFFSQGTDVGRKKSAQKALPPAMEDTGIVPVDENVPMKDVAPEDYVDDEILFPDEPVAEAPSTPAPEPEKTGAGFKRPVKEKTPPPKPADEVVDPEDELLEPKTYEKGEEAPAPAEEAPSIPQDELPPATPDPDGTNPGAAQGVVGRIQAMAAQPPRKARIEMQNMYRNMKEAYKRGDLPESQFKELQRAWWANRQAISKKEIQQMTADGMSPEEIRNLRITQAIEDFPDSDMKTISSATGYTFADIRAWMKASGIQIREYRKPKPPKKKSQG